MLDGNSAAELYFDREPEPTCEVDPDCEFRREEYFERREKEVADALAREAQRTADLNQSVVDTLDSCIAKVEQLTKSARRFSSNK